MSDLRRWMTLCEASLYPNLREIPDGERFIVYHGSADITPFDAFDPKFINSKTGLSYGAFFFARRRATAMTYMQTEDFLKPQVQAKYDELMATFLHGEATLLSKLNQLLADHNIPPMDTFSSIKLLQLQLRSQDAELKAALQQIDDAYRQISRYRNTALDLYNQDRNLRTAHAGVLYECEIVLYRPWERDMEGDAFQKDRWRNIFTTATQSGADGVILYNCTDTAVDFGEPDTIYAVFIPDQIKILDRQVFDAT